MAETTEPVAFLGLGIMGSRMAANLRRAGFEVVAWNRTRARAEELAAEHGAIVADTPADAAARAAVVISMVVDAPDVEQVLLGPGGAAEGAADGALFVDMSTIAPTAATGIAERLAARRIAFLDAPVTGSKPKAEDGTLTIMCGGDAADFERARPLFEAMGRLVLHVGPQGHGQAIKLLNNTVAAVNTAVLAQAIHAGRAAGVDLDRLVEVMQAGSGGSAVLDLKAAPIIARDYEPPLFKLDHMLKDVRHCLAAARDAGAPLGLAEAAERLYAAASEAGLGDADFAAVAEAASA
ncbi:MAG TPA: NAD(P)-dependent oxidoreductase [Thermoleophilaceae bacterium]|nr:NAD(P)-dependent oxidoreductase [Thermoleophilaceae bacterium]